MATSDSRICDFYESKYGSGGSNGYGSFSFKPTNSSGVIKCTQYFQTGFYDYTISKNKSEGSRLNRHSLKLRSLTQEKNKNQMWKNYFISMPVEIPMKVSIGRVDMGSNIYLCHRFWFGGNGWFFSYFDNSYWCDEQTRRNKAIW